jgi:hypothetical protein
MILRSNLSVLLRGLPSRTGSGVKGQLPSLFRALRRHDFTDGALRIGSHRPAVQPTSRSFLPECVDRLILCGLLPTCRRRMIALKEDRARPWQVSSYRCCRQERFNAGRRASPFELGPARLGATAAQGLVLSARTSAVGHGGSPRLSTNVLIGRQ